MHRWTNIQTDISALYYIDIDKAINQKRKRCFSFVNLSLNIIFRLEANNLFIIENKNFLEKNKVSNRKFVIEKFANQSKTSQTSLKMKCTLEIVL